MKLINLLLDVQINISDDVFDHAAKGLAAFLIALLVIGLVVAVFAIIVMWRVFVKAGQPGWACIVPFYNIIVMLRIAGKPEWWILLMLIPVVNIVFYIMMLNGISKAFGKDTGFTVGLIFLNIIFWAILAFDSSRYIGPGGVAPAASPDTI